MSFSEFEYYTANLTARLGLCPVNLAVNQATMHKLVPCKDYRTTPSESYFRGYLVKLDESLQEDEIYINYGNEISYLWKGDLKSEW